MLNFPHLFWWGLLSVDANVSAWADPALARQVVWPLGYDSWICTCVIPIKKYEIPSVGSVVDWTERQSRDRLVTQREAFLVVAMATWQRWIIQCSII